jgi:hypothetical protein
MQSKIKGVIVTPAQAEVHSVLKQFGPLPDHALVPLAQHVVSAHQSSSGIRSRRAELVRKGLASAESAVLTASGRKAIVWKAR